MQVGAELERLDVCDDVFDLGFFENVLERRHELVAILDPGLQAVVRDLVAVHGEGATLREALEAGTNLLLVARVIVADGTLLLEQRLPPRNRSGVPSSGFLGGALAERRSGDDQRARQRDPGRDSEKTIHRIPPFPIQR